MDWESEFIDKIIMNQAAKKPEDLKFNALAERR